MLRYVTFAASAAICLSGCAYVPDLEPDESFSYAEIALQIECETYLSAVQLAIDDQIEHAHDDEGKKLDPIEPTFEKWSMSLHILPNMNYDGSLNLGFSGKSSATAKNYFQIALGGGTSPGAIGYESYGTADASNIYLFPVAKLFEVSGNGAILHNTYMSLLGPVTVPMVTKKIDNSCSPVVGKSLSSIIKYTVEAYPNASLKDIPPVQQTAVPNILNSSGLLGVYDYLRRSFAVNRTLHIVPNSLTFDKSYKIKISAGVTSGWYVATGNISPNAGVTRTINNQINLNFAPQQKEQKTISVRDKEGKIIKKTIPASSEGNNGVSASTALTLLNAATRVQLQNIQIQLNELNR